MLAGVALVVAAAALARAYRPEIWFNIAALAAWSLGLASVTLRWLSPRGAAARAARALSSDKLVLHGAVLFGLALLVRTVWLETVPANLNGDAYSQALDAIAFLEGRLVNLFGTSDWYGVPLLYPWLGSFFLRVFGQEPWVWRLFTAVGGAATVPLTYMLVRAQFGRPRLALMAGTLLVFYHVHVYFSRIGSNQGFDALFTAALLFALVLAHRRPASGLWWYVAGVVAGLGFYFYFALRGVSAIGFAIVLAWVVVREAPRLRAPMWYLAGLVLAIAPLAAKPAGYGVGHAGRLRQVFDAPGSSDASVVVDVMQRGLVMMQSVHGTTLRGWYHSDAGVLVSPLELLLFGVGLVVALWLRRQAGWIHPALLFGVLGAAALFVENPIMAQRVTSVSVPVCVILALGIDRLSRLSPRRVRGFVAAALVLVVVAWNAHHLFVVHMPRRTLDGTSFLATELAGLLAREPGVTRIVVCGGDVMHWDSHSALQFRRRGLRGRDVAADARVPAREADVATAYVLLPMCDEMRQQLDLRPDLVSEELRYRETEPDEALQMYADTRGTGYRRWVPATDGVPYSPGEELMMTVYLARGAPDR